MSNDPMPIYTAYCRPFKGTEHMVFVLDKQGNPWVLLGEDGKPQMMETKKVDGLVAKIIRAKEINPEHWRQHDDGP